MRERAAGSATASGIVLAAGLIAFVIGPLPVLATGLDLLRDPSEAWSALADPVLWRRTATSAAITAGVLAVALPVGLFSAWVLARTNVPFARGWTALLALSMFLPPLVHAISWVSTLRLSGWSAILLVHVVVATPIVALLAMRSLASISRAQHDTWRLLGGQRAVVLGEMRHALPGACAGASLAAAFVLTDFTTADFLTSVGPKITTAADSVYAHHVGLRSASAAAAGLPVALIGLALLALAARDLLRRGSAIRSGFEPAPRVRLGRARVPVSIALALVAGGASAIPFAALAESAGSLGAVARAARDNVDSIGFTVATAAASATLGLTLATLILGLARRLPVAALGLIAFVPLAASPLTSGIGLIRVWNRPEFDWIYTGAAVVVLATAGRYLMLGALPVVDGMARVDRGLVESARLAGATRLAVFRGILWPLLRPSILVGWCLAFAFALRETDAFVMLRAGQSSLASRLYSNVVFAREDELAALALVFALVCATPLLLLGAAHALGGART